MSLTWYHRWDLQQLAAALRTSTRNGLEVGNAADTDARIAAFGSNRLPPPRTVTFWELVWDALQVRNGLSKHALQMLATHQLPHCNLQGMTPMMEASLKLHVQLVVCAGLHGGNAAGLWGAVTDPSSHFQH